MWVHKKIIEIPNIIVNFIGSNEQLFSMQLNGEEGGNMILMDITLNFFQSNMSGKNLKLNLWRKFTNLLKIMPTHNTENNSQYF